MQCSLASPSNVVELQEGSGQDLVGRLFEEVKYADGMLQAADPRDGRSPPPRFPHTSNPTHLPLSIPLIKYIMVSMSSAVKGPTVPLGGVLESK